MMMVINISRNATVSHETQYPLFSPLLGPVEYAKLNLVHRNERGIVSACTMKTTTEHKICLVG